MSHILSTVSDLTTIVPDLSWGFFNIHYKYSSTTFSFNNLHHFIDSLWSAIKVHQWSVQSVKRKSTGVQDFLCWFFEAWSRRMDDSSIYLSYHDDTSILKSWRKLSSLARLSVLRTITQLKVPSQLVVPRLFVTVWSIWITTNCSAVLCTCKLEEHLNPKRESERRSNTPTPTRRTQKRAMHCGHSEQHARKWIPIYYWIYVSPFQWCAQ